MDDEKRLDRMGKNDAEAEWLNMHVGTLVNITLMNGAKICGTLNSFDRETLIIERSGARHQPILVFKNGILCVEERLPGAGAVC